MYDLTVTWVVIKVSWIERCGLKLSLALFGREFGTRSLEKRALSDNIIRFIKLNIAKMEGKCGIHST